MNTLIDLLTLKQIRSVLVVDDAFDPMPLPSDLVIDRDEWSQFFADLTDEDKTRLSTEYPEYDAKPTDELLDDSLFVSCVWRLRDQLSDGTAKVLFERYVSDNEGAMHQLNSLLDLLRSYNIDAVTTGRNFEAAAESADLIIIDLYLGSGQGDQDMNLSIEGLKRVTKKRLLEPPLVVLMSSSTRLQQNYAHFRDATGLFASGFRFIRKVDFAEPKALERILHRLAMYRDESRKLAAFVNAWQNALQSASLRTTSLLQRLDLSEFGQIYNLLLEDEEAPVGSFFVDVVDRVLQHEVEAEVAIIHAAQNLNAIDFSSIPPRYVGESPDLQSFVFRSTFEHPTRLQLNGNGKSPVVFGDLLLPKVNTLSKSDGPVLRLEILPESVFAVLTPACSLQRGEAKRVLLLAGTVQNLTMKDWYIKESPIRTPVMELADSAQKWIKWDLEHVETISKSHLEELLAQPNGLKIAGRLRDLYALELQQKLLAHLGRVGVSAPMPGAFEVRLTLAFVGSDEKWVTFNEEGADNLQGIVFVGRKRDERQSHLTLTEPACHTIIKSLGRLATDPRLHPSGQSSLQKILAEREYDLIATLESSLPLKDGMMTKYLPVPLRVIPSEGAEKAGTAFYMTRMERLEGQDCRKNMYLVSPIAIVVSDVNSFGPLEQEADNRENSARGPVPTVTDGISTSKSAESSLPQSQTAGETGETSVCSTTES